MTMFEKVIKYAATAFAAILAVGIVVGVLEIGLSVARAIAGNNVERTDLTTTFPVADIQAISMNNSASDVLIEYYSGDEITIDAKNVPVTFHCGTDNNGTLTIKNSSIKNTIFSFGNKKSKITLYLPMDFELSKLDLGAGVGDVIMHDLKIGTLTINGGVGDIDASGLSVDKFTYKGGVGDIEMKKCTINTTKIDGGVGDVDIVNSLLKDIDIDNGVGDIEIEIKGNIDDYSFDIDKGLGDIEINGKKPSYYKENKGQYKISCDNGVGDIEITIR